MSVILLVSCIKSDGEGTFRVFFSDRFFSVVFVKFEMHVVFSI